jgi:phosphoglycolate phosphatase-like HAD superfamily hydrolase
MGAAFGEVTGRPDAIDGMSFGGMTDRLIARTGLNAASMEPDDELIDRLLAAYLARLPAELETTTAYTVFPGVREAVAVARDRDGFAVGLGTGNIEPGARLKLGRGELSDPFSFGGFGSDAEDRVELLRVGFERGANVLGRPAAACRRVIVGDTPRDVRAALALEVECVAVGTGGHEAVELARLGATRAFDDLSSPGAVAAILDG